MMWIDILERAHEFNFAHKKNKRRREKKNLWKQPHLVHKMVGKLMLASYVFIIIIYFGVCIL